MSDYIKREDAIGIVKNLKRFSCFGDDGFVEIPMVYCELMQVATADVAPVRHGRWEEIDDLDFDTLYRCSVCGEEFHLIDGTPRENQCYYCPCCGSKMDEEVDERMRMTREEMAKEYQQKLTKQVKAVGQELIDRADDLVGHGGAISDFAIVLYFEQDSMPKIKLLREHMSMRCLDMEVKRGDD